MHLQSPRLTEAGFRHAFFTRAGGVSRDAYASLNFSYAVGDEPSNVDENLRRAGESLGLPADRVFFAAQVHGNGVLELTGDEEQIDVVLREADALVSAEHSLGCGVRTADCVPILIADRDTGRVAAVHAGWRGLVNGVIDSATGSLGGRPRHWVAAIGPHISVDAFEISNDVAEQLRQASDAPNAIVRTPGRKPHASLRAIAQAQLETLGVPPQQIDQVPGCTLGQPERFFSYRRDGKASGRHLSVIVPKQR